MHDEVEIDVDDRGLWPSEEAYILASVMDQLPVHLQWLLECCDEKTLRARYESGVRVWSRPAGGGKVQVFESPR